MRSKRQQNKFEEHQRLIGYDFRDLKYTYVADEIVYLNDDIQKNWVEWCKDHQ